MDSAENGNGHSDGTRLLESGALRVPMTVVVVGLAFAAPTHAQSTNVADSDRLVHEVQANPTFPQAAPSATDNSLQGPATAIPGGIEDSHKTPINRQAAGGNDIPVGSAGNPIWTTLGLLCLLLSGLFAVLKLLRRYGPRRFSPTDPQHIQILDRQRLDSQTTVYLLRVGRRLIVAANSSGGLNALAEIGDPEEVAEICGHQPHPGAAAQTLGSLFSDAQSIRRESAPPDSGTTRKPPATVGASTQAKPRATQEAWHA